MAARALLAAADPAALSLLGAAAALLAAAVLAADWLRGASPRARAQARLGQVLRRAAVSHDDEPEGGSLFLAQRRGLRGRLSAWLAELSIGVGGASGLRLLWGGAAGSAIAGTVVASGALGLPAPMAAGAGLGAGFVGFRAIEAQLRRRWSIAFLDQLVEAVELMTRSVRSGFTPGAAIRIVSAELGAPVGPVFARIADEDELGVDLRQSLRRAARRVRLPDFSFLAVALILQRETGGQLADTLDGLHLMLRRRRETRLKLHALTSEGRMSATILSLLPFVAGAGVAIASPDEFARLFTTPLGERMLAVGGAMLAVGVAVMRWMAAPRA
jgi:Flp pilus assembly protein TadB